MTYIVHDNPYLSLVLYELVSTPTTTVTPTTTRTVKISSNSGQINSSLGLKVALKLCEHNQQNDNI